MATNPIGSSVAVLAAALLLSSLGEFTVQAEEKPPQPVTIKKVVSAKLSTEGKSLTVTAVGEVPTGGYTKPTLTRVQYFKQPDDGIQDYTFEAVPPTGIATQVISQVTATDKWRSLPGWVKGVRIHGVGDGVMMKMLGEK